MLLITTFYLIRMSRIRNSSPPPFHPGVSHPKPCCVAIPSGCLTPGNPSPPTFHPEFFCAAIPYGCLTPGFPLRHYSIRMSHTRNPICRRSTFFFIPRAFSLGSKITFLIKLCCHFHFRQAIFHTFSVFKMF